METIKFLGRTSPPGIKFNLAIRPTFGFKDEALAYEIHVVLKIEHSEIEVAMTMPKLVIEDFDRILLRARDIASFAVDLAAFAYGGRIVTLLERYVDPTGAETDLGQFDEKLRAECTALAVNTVAGDTRYEDIFQKGLSDTGLMMALRDLVEAHASPHTTPTNCGRVLDAIRRLITPNAPTPKKGWEAMQTALNIATDYQKWVTDLSAEPRHGSRAFIDGPTIQELQRRTWAIMNRFLIYQNGGNSPLAAPGYPPLIR